MKTLVDLRDLEVRGKTGEFGAKLVELEQRHASKHSFAKKLRKVGL